MRKSVNSPHLTRKGLAAAVVLVMILTVVVAATVRKQVANREAENECEVLDQQIRQTIITGITSAHENIGGHWRPVFSLKTKDLFGTAVEKIDRLEALQKTRGRELDG